MLERLVVDNLEKFQFHEEILIVLIACPLNEIKHCLCQIHDIQNQRGISEWKVLIKCIWVSGHCKHRLVSFFLLLARHICDTQKENIDYRSNTYTPRYSGCLSDTLGKDFPSSFVQGYKLHIQLIVFEIFRHE